MRLIRVLAICALLVMAAGCTCRAKKVGPGDNIPVAAQGDVLSDVNFAFDSSVIDGLAKSVLQQNFEYLNTNMDVNVQIEGHCDERGTAEYNLALGHKRARATMDYLVSLGITAERLSTVSYGEELPLDPGKGEEAWSKNRRAHFVIK